MPTDAKNLPVYNPKEAVTCPACGNMGHSTSYCKGKVSTKTSDRADGGKITEKVYECPEEIEGGHLHRTCERCGRVTPRRGYDY